MGTAAIRVAGEMASAALIMLIRRSLREAAAAVSIAMP